MILTSHLLEKTLGAGSLSHYDEEILSFIMYATVLHCTVCSLHLEVRNVLPFEYSKAMQSYLLSNNAYFTLNISNVVCLYDFFFLKINFVIID